MGDWYIRTVNNVADAKYYSFNEVAIGFTKSTYYSMVQYNHGLEDFLGTFYGLFSTYYGIGAGDIDDFCDDTYTAAYSNMSLGLIKRMEILFTKTVTRFTTTLTKLWMSIVPLTR